MTERASGRTQNATTDLFETIGAGYPEGPLQFTYYNEFNGVAVDFSQETIEKGLSPSTGVPLALQFTIPLSAGGMVNPLRPGEYVWLVSFFRDLANSCEPHHEFVISKVGPVYKPGELQLFHYKNETPAGYPRPRFMRGTYESGMLIAESGSTITVIGNGFRPSELVKSVKVGAVELYPSDEGRTYHDERNADSQ